MKNLVFICLIALFIGCKENLKEDEKIDAGNQTALEDTISRKIAEIHYEDQIIPGKRLGNIVINENATAVLDSLGKPDSGDAAMGKAVSTWHENSEDSLSIYTTTQMGMEDFSRVKAIRTLSPKYRTEKNLGVNSTLSEIEEYFTIKRIGDFTSDGKYYTLFATNEGIGFEISEDQVCHGIVLTEKGTEPQQTYLTFYPDLKRVE